MQFSKYSTFMPIESKRLKILAIAILDFLGRNSLFLVRKNICCHLLDFILHSCTVQSWPYFLTFPS